MSAKTTRRFRWFLIGSIALCGAGFGFASDAADEPRPRFVGADPAFWVDPAEPSRSTLIGQRGEAVGVYDLRGSVIQSLSQASLQADLRHGVVMDGRAETIAALSGGPVRPCASTGSTPSLARSSRSRRGARRPSPSLARAST